MTDTPDAIAFPTLGASEMAALKLDQARGLCRRRWIAGRHLRSQIDGDSQLINGQLEL